MTDSEATFVGFARIEGIGTKEGSHFRCTDLGQQCPSESLLWNAEFISPEKVINGDQAFRPSPDLLKLI